MNTYYTVIVPWSDTPTEWHPTTPIGPFSRLSRGAFKTIELAGQWAADHLNGQPFEIKRCEPDGSVVSAEHQARDYFISRLNDLGYDVTVTAKGQSNE